MPSGTIIVIDGLDGSGKSTQAPLLFSHMQKICAPKPVRLISFPDYEQPSSALVKMYLAGEFSSDPDAVNAYAASSFYAVDRYASYKRFWEEDYQAGAAILATRYVTSNAVHQMPKLPRAEWDDYLAWLEEYEYDRLSLPRPNLVLYLDMPVEVSAALLSHRYSGEEARKDIHEADRQYLQRCREGALYAAHRLGWTLVDCAADSVPRGVEEIRQELCHAVSEVLGK